VKEKGRQERTLAGESRCARSESLYVFPLGLCCSFEFMDFIWVYGFPLGIWLSFGFMDFLWICGFPLSLWISFGSMSVSFLWVGFIHMFLQVCVYSYTDKERGAPHNGQGRSCEGKICVSPPPPPPVSLAED